MEAKDVKIGQLVTVDLGTEKIEGTVRAFGFHGTTQKADVVIHHAGHRQDGAQISVLAEQLTLREDPAKKKQAAAK